MHQGDAPLWCLAPIRGAAYARVVTRSFGTLKAVHSEFEMQPPKLIEDVAARLSKLIEQSPMKDVEKNVKAAVTGAFQRLDLVTREEFEVQNQVLLRTRERLAELEKRVAELEQQAKGESPA